MQRAQVFVLGERGPGGWSYPCTSTTGVFTQQEPQAEAANDQPATPLVGQECWRAACERTVLQERCKVVGAAEDVWLAGWSVREGQKMAQTQEA